ncbi:hypothetical protein EF294_08705 [Gordonia oryzae]|uniref:Uncharacterized protein n=1 Tax=Gordonia oryzae TaxID=2487349 RepID=A0A3N4GKY2_9ACTN|nr:hypothetical protein [Gordonia oryzae]RPA63553.1 hypothetical protein EF294_08705 [Gordonia oryzae]
MEAVGSTTTPQALRRKFVDAGPDTPILFDRVVRVWMADLDVTHSAHVTRHGYVHAAPYRRPGARLATTAAWLEQAHLAALDSTEPDYHRMTVSSTSLSLRLDRLAATDRATRLIESVRAAGVLQDAGLTEVAEAR